MPEMSNRIIVVKLANGDDYAHSFPLTTYKSLSDFVREHGESYVLALANRRYEEMQRSFARHDALREARQISSK